MDPVTQGFLGAAFGQAVFGRKLGRGAALVGALAGTIGDLDVLQGFFLDPITNIALHRHWTHSLLFLPIGAAIACLPFLAYKKWKNRWELIYAAAFIGYLSHLLIDACTSYGTVLFWPISNHRVAFDSMPIIDPIFTSVLMVAVIWAAIAKKVEPARIGLAVALLYVALGFVQHERALETQQQLAELRGDVIEDGRVMPTLGNIIVWRSVYRTQWLTHSDAVRVGPGDPTVVQGQIAATMTERRLPFEVEPNSRFARDFKLWMWFNDGYATAIQTDGKWAIADTRYSMQTEGFSPIWAMSVDASQPGSPTTDVVHLRSGRKRGVSRLWEDITAGDRFVAFDSLVDAGSFGPKILPTPINFDQADTPDESNDAEAGEALPESAEADPERDAEVEIDADEAEADLNADSDEAALPAAPQPAAG